jgi:hypothetical protein
LIFMASSPPLTLASRSSLSPGAKAEDLLTSHLAVPHPEPRGAQNGM